MNRARLEKQLTLDEGCKNKPYTDTVGKLTIGVGRNLDDRGLSADEIQLILRNDIDIATRICQKLIPTFDQLDDVRQEVLVNMAFNLGQIRLAGFKKFLAAVAAGNFDLASDEMLDSTWATQVGERATRLASAMEKGRF
ncbi:glycoside hydrolase family protein [Pseudomonas luteola]|uniref:glycoside hydrolase family protein n=1 Tax=Pseudomonas luteola TaxID=47886 RepID=UPI003A848897